VEKRSGSLIRERGGEIGRKVLEGGMKSIGCLSWAGGEGYGASRGGKFSVGKKGKLGGESCVTRK